MYNGKKSVVIRLAALILIVAMVVPVGAAAATSNMVQPYASSYLSSYGAYVSLSGNQVQVWFDIYGAGTMDEVGTLFIEIWESTDNVNWSWVETFNQDTTPGMLGYGDYYHGGHVTYYNGVAGRYYKAYVCAWAGKNGSGDTRYFWTTVKP